MTEDQEFPSSGNIFTGNVSSVSEISSSLPITPVDPKRFIWSQFFIGLLLVQMDLMIVNFMEVIILEVQLFGVKSLMVNILILL